MIKHRMRCFVVFSSLIFDKTEESVSVQSYKMTVQDMDIPYPSQHTLSGNHQPASEMPSKCFRCCIANKGRKEGGGGGGGWGPA